MRYIQVFKRKFRPFRLLARFPIFLVFLTSIACLGVLGMGQHPLQAQFAPTSVRGNPWQYATFPVENFQTYSSLFGYRISPVDGKYQFHSGIDMAAPLGSYVRNWWEGRVVELSDHTGCGTMIRIKSGRWQHVYCHLAGRVVENGRGRYLIDREGGIAIHQGQTIPLGARMGRVGLTGRTTGPHLHWGLIYDGNYVDPALVLQAMLQKRVAS